MADSISKSSGRKGSNSLLTKKSLALSLAAPRVPPHGTAHRALLMGSDPTALPWAHHHSSERQARKNINNHDRRTTTSVSHKNNDNLRRRLVAFLQASTATLKSRPQLPHPHLPTGPELAEYITRFLGVWLPIPFQNWLRDSGHVKAVIDTALTLSAPAFVLSCPDAMVTFQELTQKCQTLRYGNHPSQAIDLFLPDETKEKVRGLVFFVHGGAWGSGMPWCYRLMAAPFLEINMAVAIVGYRTFPDGDIHDQVHDLEVAAEELAQHYPQFCQEPTELGVCVMGHSSGAHIAFLMTTEWTRRRMRRLEKIMTQGDGRKITASMVAENNTTKASPGMRIDSFVGISGPYNISHHFDYEASRGLEEISPLKAAMRFSREEFRKHSPAINIVDCLSEWSTECEARALDNVLPAISLMHGIEDDIVPFTATAEAASLLRSCGVTKLDEVYFARTGHNECVLEIMTGGQVRDTLMDWIERLSIKQTEAEASKSVVMTSRL